MHVQDKHMLSKSHYSEISTPGYSGRDVVWFINPRKRRREDEFLGFSFIKAPNWRFKPHYIKKQNIMKKYPEVQTERKQWSFDFAVEMINDYIRQHSELRYDMIKSAFDD